MLVAIPVWQGRVSPVFDSARKLTIVQIENGISVGKSEVLLGEKLPLHRVERLVNLEVEVLICGAISRALTAMCLSSGITVLAWVSGPLEEVIQAFIAGRLPDLAYTMPGCCGRRLQARRRRKRGGASSHGGGRGRRK